MWKDYSGTIKQKEIYIAKNYASIPEATEAIGEYINYYNEISPHQSLWNFTPNYIYECGNKSEALKRLEELKEKTKTMRKEYFQMERDSYLLDQFIKEKAQYISVSLSN